MVLDAVQHKKQLADLSLVSFVHSEIVVQEKSAPLSYEVNNVQHHSFYQTPRVLVMVKGCPPDSQCLSSPPCSRALHRYHHTNRLPIKRVQEEGHKGGVCE